MDHKNPENKQPDSNLSNKQDAEIRSYDPPKLKEFGSLTELTAAGTGATTEVKPGQGPTSKRP